MFPSLISFFFCSHLLIIPQPGGDSTVKEEPKPSLASASACLATVSGRLATGTKSDSHDMPTFLDIVDPTSIPTSHPNLDEEMPLKEPKHEPSKPKEEKHDCIMDEIDDFLNSALEPLQQLANVASAQASLFIRTPPPPPPPLPLLSAPASSRPPCPPSKVWPATTAAAACGAPIRLAPQDSLLSSTRSTPTTTPCPSPPPLSAAATSAGASAVHKRKPIIRKISEQDLSKPLPRPHHLAYFKNLYRNNSMFQPPLPLPPPSHNQHHNIFELGRQDRPGRYTGIRLYRPVPAEGQNKSWGHRITAKACTY
jgi:hypothetical protein